MRLLLQLKCDVHKRGAGLRLLHPGQLTLLAHLPIEVPLCLLSKLVLFFLLLLLRITIIREDFEYTMCLYNEWGDGSI